MFIKINFLFVFIAIWIPPPPQLSHSQLSRGGLGGWRGCYMWVNAALEYNSFTVIHDSDRHCYDLRSVAMSLVIWELKLTKSSSEWCIYGDSYKVKNRHVVVRCFQSIVLYRFDKIQNKELAINCNCSYTEELLII